MNTTEVNMKPRIETLTEKKLIGKRVRMTLSNNKTSELWQSFMPKRREIKNIMSEDLFSVQVYDKSPDFKHFNPETEFEKWAAVEAADFDAIPGDMEPFTLKSGLYAVFLYKGDSRSFSETFHYIFNEWLPGSDYSLDDRAHFEILGEKYRNNDPASEEEVWIPIKPII